MNCGIGQECNVHTIQVYITLGICILNNRVSSSEYLSTSVSTGIIALEKKEI